MGIRVGCIGISQDEPSAWEEDRLPNENQYRKLHRPFEGAEVVVDGRGASAINAVECYVPCNLTDCA